MPIDASLIVAGTAAAIKVGVGAEEKSAASNDLKSAIMPRYKIPWEWYDNDAIAGSEAQHGLTEPAMNYYSTMASRGLGSGLGSTLQAGGNVNNIADLYDSYSTGVNKIAAEDAQLKNENIGKFIEANANVANEKDKAWTLNEYQPYENRVKADNQKLNAGQQTEFNGLTDLTNTGAAFATSQMYKGGSAGQTMGEKLGNENLDAGVTPASLPANMASFGTPGGQVTMQNLLSNNPNSPYLQQLLKTMNQYNQVS